MEGKNSTYRVDEDLFDNYSHYQEEEWDVWERKQISSMHSDSLSPFLPNVEYYKIVSLYIKHLNVSEQKDKYFIFRNICFLYVNVSGTIVSNKNHKEKLCLEVSDGTGNITCLLEDDMLNKIRREKLDFNAAYKTDYDIENTVLHQAYLMNVQARRYLYKAIPSEDFYNGNIVALNGKLTEHNGKKYIFVTRISTIAVADHVNNLQRCLSMYNTYIRD